MSLNYGPIEGKERQAIILVKVVKTRDIFSLFVYEWHFLLFSAGSAGLWNISRRDVPKIRRFGGIEWQKICCFGISFLIFGGKCRLVEHKPARCAENKAIRWSRKVKKYIVSGLSFLFSAGSAIPHLWDSVVCRK